MNYAGNEPKKGEKNIQPEMLSKPHLKKYPQGRKKNRNNNFYKFHICSCSYKFLTLLFIRLFFKKTHK